MDSFVDVPFVRGELRAIKYQAARVLHYGPNDKFSSTIPAVVSFQLGGACVALTIADAQDLLEALPRVLAQHDYADFLTVEPKAVA